MFQKVCVEEGRLLFRGEDGKELCRVPGWIGRFGSDVQIPGPSNGIRCGRITTRTGVIAVRSGENWHVGGRERFLAYPLSENEEEGGFDYFYIEGEIAGDAPIKSYVPEGAKRTYVKKTKGVYFACGNRGVVFFRLPVDAGGMILSVPFVNSDDNEKGEKVFIEITRSAVVQDGEAWTMRYCDEKRRVELGMNNDQVIFV